jgi:hypothetical protein
MLPICSHLVSANPQESTIWLTNTSSDCPRSRPLPTSHYMDAAQLHPRSRQRPRRMDLERSSRPNPHADYDWFIRSRGMGSRLLNLF